MMVLNRRASWLRSSTLRTSGLSGVSIGSGLADQQFACRRLIGDEHVAVHELDRAEEGEHLVVAARNDDPARNVAELLDRYRHDTLVDRMIHKLAATVVEVVEHVADRAQANEPGPVF